jgi:hypothetical protein
MTSEEVEASQSGVEEGGGLGGPGAPTPLSALEVRMMEEWNLSLMLHH